MDHHRAQEARVPCPVDHQQELAVPEVHLHLVVPKERGSAAAVTDTQNQNNLT